MTAVVFLEIAINHKPASNSTGKQGQDFVSHIFLLAEEFEAIPGPSLALSDAASAFGQVPTQSSQLLDWPIFWEGGGVSLEVSLVGL